MGQNNTGAWVPMTTATKQLEQQQDETVSESVSLGGRLRRVDVNSGVADFEWVGIVRPLYFCRDLASTVRELDGKWVRVRGTGTFNVSDEDLIQIDLDAVSPEPGPDGLPAFDPDPVKHASFDFDVDEFLRGIYEARRGGGCSCDSQ